MSRQTIPDGTITPSGQNDALAASPDQPRFCSSCSRTRPVTGGALVRCANGAKRWKCADCRARSKSHLESLQTKSQP